MTSISVAAPQLLVDELDEALAFYEERLGFARGFVYADFYASVSRDSAVIHLKCAPKLAAEFLVEEPDGYELCFAEVV